ncbi:MAG: histidinol-phosphate transaminase [Coriobacteriales bacterium]|nr:histidinol-phosphate transaminase [Coriobacteriales bacterium]
MNWNTFFRPNINNMEAYQPGLREEQIRELVEVDQIYKLSSNESPLPPFLAALDAMQGALQGLNEYPDGSGYHMTKTISEHYGVPAENICCGNGTNEILTLIAKTCLTAGSNVVYGWPSFIVYRYSAQLMDVQFREVPLLDNGAYNLESLLAAIDDKTKLVYVCTPNNPTGACVSHADLASFIQRVPEDVLIVLDAAYEEFVTDLEAARTLDLFKDTINSLDKHAVVVLRTFSKIYALAGIRAGYAFAPTMLVQAINKIREPFNVNSLAQLAAAASLQDTTELNRRQELNKNCRERLQACFAELGLRYLPSQANYVWVDIPNPQQAFEFLLKRGIIVRSFAAAGGLRIGVGDEAGTASTIAAFKELLR